MPNPGRSPFLVWPYWIHKIKRFAWFAIGFVAVTLAVILAATDYVDLGLFKYAYLPRVEEALNRRIDVGAVRLSLIPRPLIRLSKLKISNGPLEAGDNFFSAEQVQLRVKLSALVRGHFEASELAIDKPIVNLARWSDGTFNFSDLARKKALPGNPNPLPQQSKTPRLPAVSVAPLSIPRHLSIRDGELNLMTNGQASVTIKGIDLSWWQLASHGAIPFRASFSYPGLQNVAWEGELDYQQDKARLELKNNHLEIRETTLPLQGSVNNLSGIPRVHLSLDRSNVDAAPIFRVLSIFGLRPPDTEISGPMEVALDVTGPATAPTTQFRGRFLDVEVRGKGAFSGRLAGKVWMQLSPGEGTLSHRLQGNGTLAARNGELTNVDLIRRIERATGMIGLSRDERHQATTFEVLEADFVIGRGYVEFTRIYLVNPQLEVTGRGTMTLERPTLDMELSTALAQQASARAGRSRMANFFRDGQGRIAVPLKVAGPLDNPSINLNVSKLAESGLPKNLEQAFSSFFNRLFHGRKKETREALSDVVQAE